MELVAWVLLPTPKYSINIALSIWNWWHWYCSQHRNIALILHYQYETGGMGIAPNPEI